MTEFTEESFREDMLEGRMQIVMPGPSVMEFATVMLTAVVTANGTQLFAHPLFEEHPETLKSSVEAMIDDLRGLASRLEAGPVRMRDTHRG
jgi:hypothetical protein